MSSSREVTAQKKKDVWEEAGGEFYQESYPCGSKRPNNTHHRRPTRLGIPLPSHTARRGSLLQARANNKTGGGRRKLLTNNTGARTATANANAAAAQTYTSTMATADVNGTTTNVNDIQVAILPDLSEETILNERKTWEELLRIKSMPVPMAQKKLLKAQLTNLPKLRLKGISHFKYTLRKSWNNFILKLSHTKRHMVFLNGSLRTIEHRRGTGIANVFLFIKLTILLNLALSIAMLCFVIVPYLVYDIKQGGRSMSMADPKECGFEKHNPEVNLSSPAAMDEFLDCCRAKYELERDANETGIHGIITGLTKELGLGDFENWPIQFSFYHESHISIGDELRYPFAVAYVFTGCLIMCFCLFLIVYNISNGVREIIKLREGEFFKYSNLIFSGWDHYTIDEQGAEFKRGMIRNEMKMALHTEKKKITDTGKTRKERLKLLLIRVFVNVTVIGMIIAAGAIIINMTLRFRNYSKNRGNFTDVGHDKIEEGIESVLAEFSTSFVIAFFNLIFPIIYARLGKLEEFPNEVETGLVLLRSLMVRLISIYAAARVFYQYTYCTPSEGTCTTCVKPEEDVDGEYLRRPASRKSCWEGQFAFEVYKLVFVELAIKTMLTFIGDPLRRLVKYCCKNRCGRRVGRLSFNIVRHSLDIIYIQILAWISFYFAPFMPIVVMIYCYVIFYIKRFGVLHNVNYIPDTFRTTRTTAVFLAAKVISFIVVLFTYAFILGYMTPSRECGPFRGKDSAWEAVAAEFGHFSFLSKALDFIFPGVAIPVTIMLLLLTYYYYSVAQANRAMVETLRHLLVLEGHDKQYLFSKLNSLRRKSQSNSPTTEDGDATLNQP